MTASPPERSLTGAGHLSRLGLLAAAAVAAYVFESLLPSPVPWARIGLSNVFVVTALFAFGTRDALLVNLVRVIAGNFLMGFMFSPAFIFSLAGSTSALGVMALLRWRLSPPLSVVGVSCLGAVTNNVVQVTVFTLLFSAAGVARGLMGSFILLGTGVGFFTGMVAMAILSKVRLETARPVD
ncbi:Gx transporter family protein [Candidatus Eisenbacteria bacterium]|uniref:Gx transporter family protein n=1 Tax=Eiseniibacteriota bacterium TaxID=2212470 RepID=A0ABV6YQE7_UNCEI